MILKIEIPEKFIEHFGNDKFKDSLGRICYDIENAFKTGSGVSGLYEWELVEMLADAFAKSEDYDHANERMEQAGDKLEATVEQLQQCIKELEAVISKKETTTPKWISVKDRLPKEDEFVLVMRPKAINYKIDVVIWSRDYYSNDVTHWMPLPTPPTTEEK